MKADTVSFKDILREKMGDSPSENKGKSPSSEPHLKNVSSTEFFEQINFETVFFTAKKYSRSASLTAKKIENPIETAVKTPSVEVVFEVNSLSKEAFFALEMMKSLGAFELNTTEITLSQVKKAFRRLCVVYHPDRIPSEANSEEIKDFSLRFSQLKTAKDELEESFTLYIKSKQAA